MNKKYYYELNYDEYYNANDYMDGLQFFPIDNWIGIDVMGIFDYILKLENKGRLTELNLTIKDIYICNKYAFYDLIQHELDFNNYEHDYDYIDYLYTLEECLNDDGYIYEALENLIQYSDDNDFENVLNQLLNKLGYKAVEFSVDRSESFIAVAPIDFCDEFIIDVGRGENFYTITQYDENSEILDSVSGCYIKDENELKEFIFDNFINNSDNINIVDNDEAYYLIKNNKTFKKFNKIIEETYSFEPIK